MKLISTLPSPVAFKEQLDQLIKKSKRVKLSSLYLGTSIDKGTILVDGQRSKRSPPIHSNCYYYNTSKYRRHIPYQFNEIGELFHCKLCVFDTQVILSGANLSSDYFTNRQDRYYVVNNHHFADMMDELMAFMIQTDAFQKDIKVSKPLNQQGVVQIQNWANFQQKKLINTFKVKPSGTHIIPILNWPRLDIKFDILNFLQSHFSDEMFTISTAYFNPDSRMRELIKNDAQVIAPSIETHGFYGGKGLKKYIPLLYQQKVNENEILTYNRPDYTYHAKGIWIKDETHTVTVVGSNNFGARSTRDVELDFIILSDDAVIRNEIEQELQDILKYCEPRKSLELPIWLRLCSKILGPIL